MLPVPNDTVGAATRPTEPACPARLHTNGTYAHKTCRCEVGRAARRAYTRAYRARSVPVYRLPVLASRRRVQGLMAQAWNGEHIAAAAGLTDKTAAQLVSHIATERQYVLPSTAAAVERAATALGDEYGPSTHARQRAEKRGYVPLYAWMPGTIDLPWAEPWMDEVAIERAVRAARLGLDPPAGLSRAEMRAAVAKMATVHRMHDSAISRGLHRSQTWVRAAREATGARQVVSPPGRRAA
jgi:hypothetical protein